MIAVAAVPHGSLTLLILGLAISIPLVVFGSTLLLHLSLIGAVIVIAAGTLLARRKTVGPDAAASDRRES